MPECQDSDQRPDVSDGNSGVSDIQYKKVAMT